MTEGTRSILFGCHNICHSICVFIAWIKVYRKFPAPWQVFCILIHDIGYYGRNYLSDNTNDGHELAGARLAKSLFGPKGWDFVYGHRGNNDTESMLELADDYSWLVAPLWLLDLNNRIEGFQITSGKTWKEAVRKKIETNAGGSLYELYQDIKEDK